MKKENIAIDAEEIVSSACQEWRCYTSKASLPDFLLVHQQNNSYHCGNSSHFGKLWPEISGASASCNDCA